MTGKVLEIEIMPKGLPHGKRVELFLKEHQNAYCDDCLSAILKIYPRQQVNQICRENSNGVIKRWDGHCFWCDKYKLVNRYKVKSMIEDTSG